MTEPDRSQGGPLVGIVGGSRSDFPILQKAEALAGETRAVPVPRST